MAGHSAEILHDSKYIEFDSNILEFDELQGIYYLSERQVF